MVRAWVRWPWDYLVSTLLTMGCRLATPLHSTDPTCRTRPRNSESLLWRGSGLAVPANALSAGTHHLRHAVPYNIVPIDPDNKVKPWLQWQLGVRVLQNLEAIRAVPRRLTHWLWYGLGVETGYESVEDAEHGDEVEGGGWRAWMLSPLDQHIFGPQYPLWQPAGEFDYFDSPSAAPTSPFLGWSKLTRDGMLILPRWGLGGQRCAIRNGRMFCIIKWRIKHVFIIKNVVKNVI